MATGHQSGLSYLRLDHEEGGSISVVYKKPIQDMLAKGIEISFPSSCSTSSENDIVIENGFIIDRYRLFCDDGTLMGMRVWIDGLVSSDKGVLVSYVRKGHVQQDLLRKNHPFILIGMERSGYEIFVDYLSLGFFHILTGVDHLLFLLALILLAANFRVLILSVTAFTVSHSATLMLSIFDLIEVPSVYAEAMIAASIVIVYREVLKDDMNSSGRRHLPRVVFLFGFLHGLGFAGMLSMIGLPHDEIPMAVLAFNVGIELGQIFFIVMAILSLLFFKSIVGVEKRKVDIALSYVFGGIAFFWLIERTLLFY
jgi:hydrogenase/urease accessory protein HupE